MRYWDPIENRVKVRYCDSTFLGHGTHTDLLNHPKSITNDLPSNKVYQLSMDRHNINLNFHKEFSRLYKEENCHCLIDIGTCSLHTVYNSFRTGVEAIGWNVKKVLKGAFHILHNSPAHGEDYESQTGSTITPSCFVLHGKLR